jgi:hypothetical protein
VVTVVPEAVRKHGWICHAILVSVRAQCSGEWGTRQEGTCDS